MNHPFARRTLARVALAVPLLSGALACGASEVTASCTVSAIAVTAPSVRLSVGQTTQAAASYSLQNCSPLPTVTWASDDAAIASVSSTGLIRAVAAGDPVLIRATVAGKSGTVFITVR